MEIEWIHKHTHKLNKNNNIKKYARPKWRNTHTHSLSLSLSLSLSQENHTTFKNESLLRSQSLKSWTSKHILDGLMKKRKECGKVCQIKVILEKKWKKTVKKSFKIHLKTKKKLQIDKATLNKNKQYLISNYTTEPW
jgi:hypothetical protein